MTARRTVRRSGEYYRVVAPAWTDPTNTRFSKQYGGRWNPPGEFGALYLNAAVKVAAANARAQHSGRAIKLFDLLPAARPELVTIHVQIAECLDACTSEGIKQLGFVDNFPYGGRWDQCQTVAREAYASRLAGIAVRSAAEVTATSFVGEELALFDGHLHISIKERRRFEEWYPDPIPGQTAHTASGADGKAAD